MFGTRTVITFLGLLALGTAIDPDNICPLVYNGATIADDTKCNGYYTCNNGKAVAAVCADPLYYDKEKGCVPKAQASCVSADDNVCEGVADGTFVSMSGSCSGYYHCSSGVGQAGYCPNSLDFNATSQMCEYATEAGCGSTSSDTSNPNQLCTYVKNGFYFGSASSCKIWQKCTNNVLTAGNCGVYLFDVQIQECIVEGSYNCQQLDSDASDTGTAPLEKCTAAEEGNLTSDPTSCGSYLRCVSGQYVAIKCQSGLYFDSQTELCKNRQDAVVKDCDRCEGSNSQFVNKADDNCEGYLVCSRGVTKSSGSCATGLYFNEILVSCVKTNPEFPACMKVASDETDESGEETGESEEEPTEEPSEEPTEEPSEEPNEETDEDDDDDDDDNEE